MALEWIGRVQISQNKLLEIVAALPDGTSEAIHGVSIANELDTMPVHGETRMNGNLEKALSWKRQIEHLNEISE
jgi:hypothetical protein